MNVSLNPTYYCNFRCYFCYLTNDELSNKKVLSIAKTRDLLDEIACFEHISSIELYGGEIGLLSDAYLNDLIDLCKEYTDNISIITNLSNIHSCFLRSDISLTVSYDFSAREKSDVVLRNLMSLPRSCTIITLVTPLILSLDVSYVISFFNNIWCVDNVELKPYSPNQSNNIAISLIEYDNLVIEWLSNKHKMRFRFINETLVEEVLTGHRSMFSDHHLYITPHGKLAVLAFDSNNNEYFKSVDNMAVFSEWCDDEKKQVSHNAVCKSCEFMGSCLTEHARPFESMIDGTCDGHYGVIKWYQACGK